MTHRCHDRQSLLRFNVDRDFYRAKLREGLGEFKVRLLNYCITSNHVHLLLRAASQEDLGLFMQMVEGQFAQDYNLRKNRSGAFWADRYHQTLVADGEHLWRCMRYIDLNMVRAGVVKHPCEWRWTGYAELVGQRRRYRLIDMQEVLASVGARGVEECREHYMQGITSALAAGDLARDPVWTESLAVGSQSLVEDAAALAQNRRRLEIIPPAGSAGMWILREPAATYSQIPPGQNRF